MCIINTQLIFDEVKSYDKMFPTDIIRCFFFKLGTFKGSSISTIETFLFLKTIDNNQKQLQYSVIQS